MNQHLRQDLKNENQRRGFAPGMDLTEGDVVRDDVELLLPNNGSSPVQAGQRTVFLSNIDQTVAFPVETVFFYEASPEQTRDVAARLKRAVSALISGDYAFMAGRLAFSVSSSRLELLCNDGGVPFAAASSPLALCRLAPLSAPNPSFHRLLLRTDLSPTVVFTVQVTRFSCGGFCVGFVTNHCVLDGKSAVEMFAAIAAACRGEEPKPRGICNDRSCLKARDPPKIEFDHDEYAAPAAPPALSAGLQYRVFPFSSAAIKQLKRCAAGAGAGESSTFEVLVAHVWRARTRAVFGRRREDKSAVVFAVDVRARMAPPLPAGFVGNAVAAAAASAAAREVMDRGLGFCVERVKAAIARVTDAYVRSAIDWLELNRGLPATGGGGFFVSAWWKLPFHELDFGLGRPFYSGPVASPMEEFVLLLRGGADDPDQAGVNVWIMLDHDNMLRLTEYIADF
ncbi:acyltransferase GLAUCE-like [Wolffia australiana]